MIASRTAEVARPQLASRSECSPPAAAATVFWSSHVSSIGASVCP